MKNNKLDVTGLGFRQAFKATLGFYAAQTVVTFLGIGTIIGITLLLKVIF